MNRIAPVLALAALLAAFLPGAPWAFEADGSSVERAIAITRTNTRDGIAAEYEHLGRAFPGWRRTRQALIQRDGRRYDVLTIVSPGGEQRDVLFAIDAFFGRN